MTLQFFSNGFLKISSLAGAFAQERDITFGQARVAAPPIRLLGSALAISISSTLILSQAAQAAPITYIPLPNGLTIPVSPLVPGDNTDTPANWSYFSIAGIAGDTVTITGLRTNLELDPAFGVWNGLEPDTSNYTDIFSNSLNYSILDSADDEIPSPGPYGDPTATFTLPSTGSYAVAFASFLSDPPTAPFTYTIQVSGLSSSPVPGPLPLFGTMAAFGYSRKLRAKIKSSSPSSLG
jgi:hypothetical protein